MKARVKADFPYPYPVTSCGGRDFFKDVWTSVPAGFEAEALNNPYLEVASEEELALEQVSGKPDTMPLQGEEKAAPPMEIIELAPNASKAAVTLAEKEGIRLALIAGTGKDGQITVADVRAYLEASKPAEQEKPG